MASRTRFRTLTLQGKTCIKASVVIPTMGAFAVGLLLSASAQAATITPPPAGAETLTYSMTATNIAGFPSGDYATVSISNVNPANNTIDGNIYFDVAPTAFFSTAPLSEGTNFGLQDFYFNYSPASLNLSASDLTLINPSSGWTVTLNKNAGGGFGTFDVSYNGLGSTRTTDLQFSIDNVSNDAPSNYVVANSSGNYFASHIGDFTWTGSSVTSGKFATPVPLPGAVWLFGSGLLGLTGFSVRRKKKF